MPQIEVTFDIDVNGIVHVSATDKATGKEQKVSIQASGGLSDEEIEKMVKDAEANKEADKAKKELVETKNQAESLINSSEKALKEAEGKVKQEDKELIEKSIADLKSVLESDSLEEIKSKLSALSEASMKIGDAMNAQNAQGAAHAENPESSDQKNEEKTVDAEYEDMSKK
jgi:molecular chaperone DnaK